MRAYIGTKTLLANAMTRGEYNAYRGWDMPANEKAGDPGYLVEYTDGSGGNDARHEGYISWSPAEVFEKAYQSLGAMSFGHAVEMMKAGHKVARTGWNGKGMFVYLVPPAAYPVQTGAAKSHFGEGSMVPYNAYLAIKGVDGAVSTWVHSDDDVLANDWQIA